MNDVRRRSGIFGSLLIASLVLLLPGTAHAHGRLKSSRPAAGAQLTQVPSSLRLDFSESPDLTFTSIRLLSSAGRDIPLGAVAYAADSRRSIDVRVAAALEPGTYTVIWQMAGDDGHPMRGRFDFSIAAGATGIGVTPVGVPSATPSGAAAKAMDSTAMANMHHDPLSMPEGNGFGADSPLYVLIRWLQFMGLLLAIGAVSFHAFVLAFIRRDPHSLAQADEPAMLTVVEARAASIGCIAALLLAVTLVLRLIAQSYAMHGTTIASNPSLMIPMLGRTMWGWGWLLQVAGVALAAMGFLGARKARGGIDTRPETPTLGHWHLWWRLAGLGAVLLAFSPGMSSHASSTPTLRSLAMLADGLHVLGASSWLGTLAVVLFAGVSVAATRTSHLSGEFVRDMINAFSPVALVSAGVATTTGVFAAWLHVGTVPNLWGSRYGIILLTKLTILGIVSITGFYNWRFVKPRLGTADATMHLRRSARVEVAVAILVLLVTSVLVASPTSMDMTM